MIKRSVNDSFRTTYHRDGSVTLWDVYSQSWDRTGRPSKAVLASLGVAERERVIRHTAAAGWRRAK